jgi:hypothetical protein
MNLFYFLNKDFECTAHLFCAVKKNLFFVNSLVQNSNLLLEDFHILSELTEVLKEKDLISLVCETK